MRNTLVLSSAIAFTVIAFVPGCGAEGADEGSQNNLGPGPGGGSGTGGSGASGTQCPDCNALGEDLEGRAGYDADEVFAGTAGAAPSSLATACAGLPMAARQFESALGNGSSFASAELTRDLISHGEVPLPKHVRTQDVLNYFPPAFDAPVASPAGADPNPPEVIVELAPRDSGTGDLNGPTDFDLLVAIKAPNAQLYSPPTVLVVLDTTPSMTSRLPRAKAAVAMLIGKLPEESEVRLRTSDSAVDVVASSGGSRAPLLAELSQVAALEAERPFSQAIAAAYLGSDLSPGSRVFAFTDGADDPSTLNVGVIQTAAENDIVLNSFAIGQPDAAVALHHQHGERFFRALAWIGRGHYAFLDADEEAEHVFANHLPAMLQTQLQNVRVGLNLPWHLEHVRDGSEETIQFDKGAKPQDMGAGAVSSFLYQLRTCDSKLMSSNAPDEITINVRYTPTGTGGDRIDLPFVFKTQELLAAPRHQVVRARAIYTYAESLKSLDERRLLQAKISLDLAASVTGDAALQGLSDLLSMHPILLAQ